MRSGRIIPIAGVAAARAVVALVLALAFWAAAPVALGWLPTTVMTASMTPAIEVGDIVVSRPVPREALLPGRVVLATDPAAQVCVCAVGGSPSRFGGTPVSMTWNITPNA